MDILGPDFLATAIVVLVGILVAALIIFVFVQFWYFYAESERMKRTVSEVSQPYDAKIEALVGRADAGTPENKTQLVRLNFLKEIKNQQAWEWSHERVNRRYSTFISITEWFVALFVLFLAVLNERVMVVESDGDYGLKRSTAVLLVFFAAMAIALPAMAQKLGFQARQQLHDFRAQRLGILIVELESGAEEPREIWQRYRKLYLQVPGDFASFPEID